MDDQGSQWMVYDVHEDIVATSQKHAGESGIAREHGTKGGARAESLPPAQTSEMLVCTWAKGSARKSATAFQFEFVPQDDVALDD